MMDAVRRSQNEKGFSILEMIVVVAMLSLIVIAISPLFGSVQRIWDTIDRQSEVTDRARVGVDRIVKALRQAQSITSITAASSADGQIDMTDVAGESLGFRRNSSTDRLQYDLPGNPTSWVDLADSIDSVYFTGYQSDGVTATTTVSNIRSIEIALTASDEEGTANAVTVTTRVALRKDVVGYDLVINEINYNPVGGGSGERRNEFVEIYNFGSTSIDVSGWSISDSSQTDSILAAGGTTIIPAGGFAVITADPTDVYSTYTVDGSAIQLEGDDDRIGNALSNGGETITIMDSSGTSVDAVTYDDAWGADGDGDTLERVSATGGSSDSGNWEASSDTGSMTAGSANSVTP